LAKNSILSSCLQATDFIRIEIEPAAKEDRRKAELEQVRIEGSVDKNKGVER
jgi:hypothetical protein